MSGPLGFVVLCPLLVPNPPLVPTRMHSLTYSLSLRTRERKTDENTWTTRRSFLSTSTRSILHPSCMLVTPGSPLAEMRSPVYWQVVAPNAPDVLHSRLITNRFELLRRSKDLIVDFGKDRGLGGLFCQFDAATGWQVHRKRGLQPLVTQHLQDEGDRGARYLTAPAPGDVRVRGAALRCGGLDELGQRAADARDRHAVRPVQVRDQARDGGAQVQLCRALRGRGRRERPSLPRRARTDGSNKSLHRCCYLSGPGHCVHALREQARPWRHLLGVPPLQRHA